MICELLLMDFTASGSNGKSLPVNPSNCPFSLWTAWFWVIVQGSKQLPPNAGKPKFSKCQRSHLESNDGHRDLVLPLTLLQFSCETASKYYVNFSFKYWVLKMRRHHLVFSICGLHHSIKILFWKRWKSLTMTGAGLFDDELLSLLKTVHFSLH